MTRIKSEASWLVIKQVNCMWLVKEFVHTLQKLMGIA